MGRDLGSRHRPSGSKAWVVIAALVLALAGCQSHAAQADPIEAGLDQEFVLHGGTGGHDPRR